MARLSRFERVSKIANIVLDDGDDLHITASFRAEEDTSSTVGNLSVFEPAMESIEETDVGSTKSISGSFDNSSEESAKSSPKSKKESSPWKSVSKRIPIRVPLKTRRLWPQRLNRFRLRQHTSTDLTEYDEFMSTEFDNIGPSTERSLISLRSNPVSSDERTLISLRSHRRDLATGRSFLVRQKAQVTGRPSMAQTVWDVGSYSSDSELESIRSRRHVVLRKEGSCGLSQFSSLTGDSFSTRSGSSQSRAMYIQPKATLLESDDTSEDEHDEDESLNGLFFCDNTGCSTEAKIPLDGERDGENHLLPPNSEDALQVTKETVRKQSEQAAGTPGSWELFTTNSSDGWPSSTTGDNYAPARGRIFSDSIIVYEIHHYHIEKDSRDPKDDSSPVVGSRERQRSFSDSVVGVSDGDSDIANIDSSIATGRQLLFSDDQLEATRGGILLSGKVFSKEDRRRYSDSVVGILDADRGDSDVDVAFRRGRKRRVSEPPIEASHQDLCTKTRHRTFSDSLVRISDAYVDSSLRNDRERLLSDPQLETPRSGIPRLGQDFGGTQTNLYSVTNARNGTDGERLLPQRQQHIATSPYSQPRRNKFRISIGSGRRNVGSGTILDGHRGPLRSRFFSDSEVTAATRSLANTTNKNAMPWKHTISTNWRYKPLKDEPSDVKETSHDSVHGLKSPPQITPTTMNQDDGDRKPKHPAEIVSSPSSPMTVAAALPPKLDPISSMQDYYWNDNGSDVDLSSPFRGDTSFESFDDIL